jgi:hypothetical protein
MSNHRFVPITLGGKQYNLRFGALGAFLLQKELGIGILEFANRVDNNQLGFMELHALLWAELESARKAEHQPPTPWTIDNVAELIDGEYEGDLAQFWQHHHMPIVQAFQNSFAVTMRQAEELEQRRAEAARQPSDPLTEAASTGDTTTSNGMPASTLPQ